MMVAECAAWYKNAIVYCVDVSAFYDSNGDGIGDIAGVTCKLDYLRRLGATALWLLPFYPSPRRDGGYDVTDYYGVDPRLGSIAQLVEFIGQARKVGIRVIIDLVVQHTSIEHPWFQAACSSRDTPYHGFYVWSADPPPQRHNDLVFPGEQAALWTYVPNVGSYYRHRFYDHQPDLNTTNPAVREEIEKIVRFWLELGVSGFRVDAAPFLMDYTGIDITQAADPYDILYELRRCARQHCEDAVLIAEANVPLAEAPRYFENGRGVQLLINFWLNQYLFLALARRSAQPMCRAIDELPRLCPQAGWANFLRNHDELNLGHLTPCEREYVYARFTADPSERIYDRGIRRRLASMLEEPRRVELAFSLMLSMPGTPVLYYGDELGMGDDLSQPGRSAVRTAMQWANLPNAGFSTAMPDALGPPVVGEGRFGYRRVNADMLERDPDSLFNRVARLIRTRKECIEIGLGELHVVRTDQEAVFAHVCSERGGRILAAHNLSEEPIDMALSGDDQHVDAALELVQDRSYAPVDRGNRIILGPWGYRWFRLASHAPTRPRDSH